MRKLSAKRVARWYGRRASYTRHFNSIDQEYKRIEIVDAKLISLVEQGLITNFKELKDGNSKTGRGRA